MSGFSRRHLLQGLGGAALTLPLLEALTPARAYAQAMGAPSKRYIVFFDGQSLGGDNDPVHNHFVPNTVGANYDLKEALLPLGALKSEVSVVSGLRIPTANGGAVPAGGRRDDFHVSSLSPLLSGVRSPTNTASAGETSDQLVANAIAGNTPHKSLVYRVQADWYLSVSAAYGRDMISYKKDSSGRVIAVPPQVSPSQAFNSLFGNFTAPGVDAATAAKLERERRARASVLDLVRSDTAALLPKLGAADKIRLQRHYDELRALEQRVAAIPPVQGSSCQKPPAPGADPQVGNPQGNNGTDNTYAVNLGYSNEEQRARAFCDMIAMALTCDLSRVVSLQMTMFQSHLNMYPLTGQATDCHELGHGGVPGSTTAAISKGIAWHVKHFAYLIQKLKETPEGNGNLLDNTVLVFLTEGGHGFDPGGQKDNSSHSTENMACLVAGRAGGLKPGKHIVAAGKHPANVLVSAMNAAGLAAGSLGEVSGGVAELFT